MGRSIPPQSESHLLKRVRAGASENHNNSEPCSLWSQVQYLLWAGEQDMCHLQGGTEAGALHPAGHHVVSDTQGPGLEEVRGCCWYREPLRHGGFLLVQEGTAVGGRGCRRALALCLFLFSFFKLMFLNFV